jgi:hypothetical protein
MTKAPRLARLLLSIATDKRDRRFALADLEEEHELRVDTDGMQAADRSYWSQVVRSPCPGLRHRLLRTRRITMNGRPKRVPIDTWWHDIRFAGKTFARTPGFTTVALATRADPVEVLRQE